MMVEDHPYDYRNFEGVGNIIKNEILYRVRVHPESIINKIPAAKINKLIDEPRIYSFRFLEWKRKYVLKKHWLAHSKKICLRCDTALVKKQTGVKKREVLFVPAARYYIAETLTFYISGKAPLSNIIM